MSWWDAVTNAVSNAATAAGNQFNTDINAIGNDWNNGRYGSVALDVLGSTLGAPIQAAGYLLSPVENAVNSNPVTSVVANTLGTQGINATIPFGPGAGTGPGATSVPSGATAPNYTIPVSQNPIQPAQIGPTTTSAPQQGPTPSGATLDTTNQVNIPSSSLTWGPISDGNGGTVMGWGTASDHAIVATSTPNVTGGGSPTVSVPASAPTTPTAPAASSNDNTSSTTGAAGIAALGGMTMPQLLSLIAGAGGAGLSVASAQQIAQAIQQGAQQQATASQNALTTQKQEFDQSLQVQQDAAKQQQTNVQPWLNAGSQALTKLQAMPADNFTAAQFQVDPGYQFSLQQGLQAIQNSAAAQGMGLSGNTEKALNNYAQGVASQQYQNAFNRYQTQYGTNLNALQSLAGLGQTATQQANAAQTNLANQTTQSSQNFANQAGQSYLNYANALAGGQTASAQAAASGYTGAANALTNALGTYNQSTLQNSLLNALTGNKGS